MRARSRRRAAGMGSGEILSLPRTWEGLREGVDLVRIEVYEDRMERLPQGSLQSLLLSPPQARGCLSPLRQNLNPNCTLYRLSSCSHWKTV